MNRLNKSKEEGKNQESIQSSITPDFSLYDDSDLKTYLLMRWKGLMLWLFVGPTGVYHDSHLISIRVFAT